ncbi:hypothetical protein CLV42_102551 [Chitinophaga ginsengisoli]|uniref:Uncharacterized protein n=1 Tax=Chitinophaga ginsengisoli TaxID=363837 RepID=A0A2P8GLX6_9BACT|nr:hypothetical protein CLV42_102551 [Chitinophaga ginsengisoli]
MSGLLSGPECTSGRVRPYLIHSRVLFAIPRHQFNHLSYKQNPMNKARTCGSYLFLEADHFLKGFFRLKVPVKQQGIILPALYREIIQPAMPVR